MVDKKKARSLAVLFTVTYMASYITRINFGAIISEIEVQTGIARTLLSMSVTGGFITYGIGQIVSGICGDYFSPKKLVSSGFPLPCLCPGTSNGTTLLYLNCSNASCIGALF